MGVEKNLNWREEERGRRESDFNLWMKNFSDVIYVLYHHAYYYHKKILVSTTTR